MKKVIAIVMVFAMLALVAAVPVKAESVETSDDTGDLEHILKNVRAPQKILLGKHSTRGLGAGALQSNDVCEEQALCVIIVSPNDIVVSPENIEHIGCIIEEKLAEIWETIGRDGAYIGQAHLCSDSNDDAVAKDLNARSIAIVTLPFKAEGLVRMKNALMGLEKLKDIADTVIVIPNDNLLELVPRMPLNAAFRFADEVLMRSIKSITEIMTRPGLINVDYADLETIID